MERERQFGRGRGAAVVPRSVRCTVYMCPRVTDCNTQREEYRIPINGRRGCGEGLEPAEPPARGHERIPYTFAACPPRPLLLSVQRRTPGRWLHTVKSKRFFNLNTEYARRRMVAEGGRDPECTRTLMRATS